MKDAFLSGGLDFEPKAVWIVLIGLLISFVLRMAFGVQLWSQGLKKLSLVKIFHRRLLDYLTQSVGLAGIYWMSCSAVLCLLNSTVILALVLVLILCAKLLRDVFALEGFVQNHQGWKPNWIAGAYYMHFIRNYFYITWLLACACHALFNLDSHSYVFSAKSESHIVDFFYYVVITMATVGYGDVYPVSASGRLMAVFIVGVSLFVLVTYSGAVISYYLSEINPARKPPKNSESQS